jgi:hypothetical protein
VDEVRRIADAVLYEGYVLWPYRRSAAKNQQRWTFGGVYPRAYSEAHPDDPWQMRTEVLVEAPDEAHVEVAVRFLHVVARQPMAGPEPVDELEIGGERHLAWDEATEREIASGPVRLADLPRRLAIAVPDGEDREELVGGAIVRSWRALQGAVAVGAERLDPGLFRLSVAIENTTRWDGRRREETLRQTFCSTHAVLRVRDGAFVSQTDPPQRLRAAAQACRNDGTWPVLVGRDGERDTVLSSWMILPDYPSVAPESPGDLFDGGEIDQLLVLSILSLTDEEKREMRATDPRVREILERTESLTPEQMMRLNGAIRQFGVRP